MDKDYAVVRDRVIKVAIEGLGRKSMYEEARLMRLLHHAHILRVFPDARVRIKHVPGVLVLARARHGDMLQHLMARGPTPLPDLLEAAWQLTSALCCCHSHAITHGDVKPENLLVGALGGGPRGRGCASSISVWLADFGLARDLPLQDERPAKNRRGSATYMAPELFSNNSATRIKGPARDVWALGVTLVTMMVGTQPWVRACLSDENYAYFLRRGRVAVLVRGADTGCAAATRACGQGGKQLWTAVGAVLHKMLAFDVRHRLSMPRAHACFEELRARASSMMTKMTAERKIAETGPAPPVLPVLPVPVSPPASPASLGPAVYAAPDAPMPSTPASPPPVTRPMPRLAGASRTTDVCMS